MAPLPKPQASTVRAIYAAYEGANEHYDSLGISVGEIGTECDRALWYGFRWASQPEEIDGRKLSIFRTGDRSRDHHVSPSQRPNLGRWRQQTGSSMTLSQNAPANDNSRRPASFDAAVLQWRPFLHKMARKLESRAQDREELVQETIATALHRWASYREGCSMPAWLVFQMRERCHAMRRKDRPLLTILPEATPATQEDHVIAVQALASVKPKYLRTMTMVAAGFNQHEIAAEEGVTHQAIHQRVHAVRKRWAAR